MASKPKVSIVIDPQQRHENVNQAFFDAVGDRFEMCLQETSKPFERELAALIRDADAMVTGWGTPTISPRLVERAERLRLVVHAQGSVKPLPYEAILAKGIILTNSAWAYAPTMAESTIGMMLALGYHLSYAHERFTRRRETSFDRGAILGIGLDGKTVGVVGLGPIGSKVAEMLAAFNVRLLAYDPYADPAVAQRLNVALVDSIDELAEESQVLTIHCGWTDETTGLVGRRALERLGPRGLLICNARMPIVDEDALFELIKAGKIHAALNLVPLREDLWLDPSVRGLPNLLLTHGSSNVSDTWYEQVSRNVATQLLNFVDGKPVAPQLTLEQVSRST